MTGGRRLEIEWLEGRYAICRLAPGAPLPVWAASESAGLLSITRTEAELSIVAPQEHVPAEITAERGWAALRVRGTLDFSLTGILAGLTGALADAGVPVFAISTYTTDVLLVREKDRERAGEALRAVAEVG